MPKEGVMSQISRPFQIALLAMVVLAGVWFFALHGHSASGGSSSSASAPTTTPAPAPSAAAEEKGAAAPTPVYNGAAPGVKGLSRAIANAHKAVAISQQNAKQLEAKSNQASTSGNGASTPGSQPTTAATPATTPAAAPTHAAVPTKTAAPRASAPGASPTAALPPIGQVLVEDELKQANTVAILFWNPKGSVDVAVRRELQALGRSLGRKIAVNYASAHQVGSFGTVTHSIQIYGTPTILLVNRKGQTTTVTGLTDAFALEQAIQELEHP
jgi:hypothetical protein